MSDHSLDARRMLCPMPVIKTQDRVESLSKGDILNVTCTDPGAANDIPAWCRINGHKLLDIQTSGEEIIIRLEVEGLGS